MHGHTEKLDEFLLPICDLGSHLFSKVKLRLLRQEDVDAFPTVLVVSLGVVPFANAFESLFNQGPYSVLPILNRRHQDSPCSRIMPTQGVPVFRPELAKRPQERVLQKLVIKIQREIQADIEEFVVKHIPGYATL